MILKQLIKYDNANALEATWVDEKGQQVRCHVYSGEQMQELRNDLGNADVAKYVDLISTCEANVVPPNPPSVAELLQQAKAVRYAEVANIKVTVGGATYDGDEIAQGRMARAALAMSDTDTLPWVTADNTIVTVNKAELLEVLRQAGLAMAAIWVKPYQ